MSFKVDNVSSVNIPNTIGAKFFQKVWCVDFKKESHCHCKNVHPQYCWTYSDASSTCTYYLGKGFDCEIKFLGEKEVFVIERPETKTPVTRFVGQNVHGKIVTKENLGEF